MRGWLRVGAVALGVLSVVTAKEASRRALAASTGVVATGGAAAAGLDAARAPERLADTGLYAAGRFGTVDERNRPFSPQYPLWSDGATKARWVFLPRGTAIDWTPANEWDFPVGTRFWKEFTFKGRKVETRFLWKASPSRWVASSYVWNEEQTDAVLAPEEGLAGVADIAPGRRHDIPSATDCLACHGSRRTGPLGFNALQLSTDRDPNAVHREALAPGMVTLKTLVEQGLLMPAQTDLVADPPRIRTGNPRTRAVLGYLAANCGGCHNRSDEIARSLVGQPTSWQVPGVPEGASVLVDAAAPDLSAILVRMGSRRPSQQMPPLGTVTRDQEALDVIRQWIAADLQRLH